MEYFPYPSWFYIVTCVAALVIGIGIRRYLDRKKMRENERQKKELEDYKKAQKRFKKQMKKAKKK